VKKQNLESDEIIHNIKIPKVLSESRKDIPSKKPSIPFDQGITSEPH